MSHPPPRYARQPGSLDSELRRHSMQIRQLPPVHDPARTKEGEAASAAQARLALRDNEVEELESLTAELAGRDCEEAFRESFWLWANGRFIAGNENATGSASPIVDGRHDARDRA